jgi:limonene-1,2-epoxide hydrolase
MKGRFMSDINAEAFVARFSRFGSDPTPARYLDLFDSEGTVQHPGMARPLAGEEIRGFISTVLSGMPDFRLRPLRWCGRGDRVFVEAVSSGSVGQARAIWPAVYCLTLRGERVIRGRSYYDRAQVVAQLERANKAGASLGEERSAEASHGEDRLDMSAVEANLIKPYVEAWRDPQPERIAGFYAPGGCALVPGIGHPLSGTDIADYYRSRLAEIDALQQHCEAYAVSPGLVFFEWRMRGAIAGRTFDVGAAERLTLEGFRIAESAGYFDTLSFEALRDPSAASRTIFELAK